MLTTEYALEEIRKMDHVIRVLESKDMDVHQKAYVEHLKSVRTAYLIELAKSTTRKPVEEVDPLEHISKFFPVDRRII